MNDRKTIVPPADIEEKDDRFVLTLDMPGVSKESVSVEAEGDTLTVTGKAMEQSAEGGWKEMRREFELADYRREFAIGDKVKRDTISAHYENGVLRVELEKSENVKPRKIAVKVA